MNKNYSYVDDVNSAKDLSSFLKTTPYTITDHPEGKLVTTPSESIIIISDYLKYINFPIEDTLTEEELIFGKNPLRRIVSIEPEENFATIFIEELDGKISTQTIPYKLWMLTRDKVQNAHPLIGKQWYKWELLFDNKEQFKEAWNSIKGGRDKKYTMWNEKENFMVKYGYTYFKGMKHNDPSILSFDIETNGLLMDENSKLLTIANTFRKNGVITKRLFSYNEYENDGKMVEEWSKWVRSLDPSLICGHNILSFDLPYIDHIALLHDTNVAIGRNGSNLHVGDEGKFRVDGGRDLGFTKCSIYGRNIIDTMLLAYRHDQVKKEYDSYRLKWIIAHEKLEKPGRVFYDAATIRDNYTDPIEFEKIKAYCEDDGDDALALYDLMSPAQFYVTQSVPKSFEVITQSAPGSQINSMLVRAYLQQGHSIAIADNLDNEMLEGGISFAVPMIYQNVIKLDIKSCYPSQILRFKLSDARKDPHEYFYKLVNYFTHKRFEYKDLSKKDSYYGKRDAAAKVFINSAYGVTNTPGLNYNSANLAKKITGESRAVIDMALRWATGKNKDYWVDVFYTKTKAKEKDRVNLSIPYVLPINKPHDFIASVTDTDSISFCKQDSSEFTNEEIKDLMKELNNLSPEKILWEDDGYYRKIIALKAKNYVLYSPTDTKKPLVIKGSALKASTKSEMLRKFMKEIINEMLTIDNQDDLYVSLKCIYNNYVYKIMNITDIAPWASRKTISEKMLESERTNELKIMEAIEDSEYEEGDRVWTFYRSDDSMCLVENFNGDYNKKRLLKNLFDTIKIFDNILPVKELFINYSLVKTFATLEKDKNDSP